jgi:phosphopantetheinyl transferase
LRVLEHSDHLSVSVGRVALVAFEEGDGAIDRCVHDWLATAEADYVRRLPSVRRRAAWLAGRLAAKTAIRRLLPAAAPLRRIEVLPAAGGDPVVLGVRGHGPAAIAVSISHTAGLAVAAACERSAGALGVDVEVLEQEIEPSLIDLAFSSEEAAVIARHADPTERHLNTLRFWTAKEAALKAVRRGLRLPLTAVRLAWAAGGRPTGATVRCGGATVLDCNVLSTISRGHVLALATEVDHER